MGQRGHRPRNPLDEEPGVEQTAYDFLRETHRGWENNEGAYGDLHFDVNDRTITLDYNERIETSRIYPASLLSGN